MHSIQDMADEFAVSHRTLRFYETKGLLQPERQGNTRLYSDRDRVRLKLTLRGKRLGFNLEECKEIIDLYDLPNISDEAQLIRLLQKIREHRAKLLQKMQDIENTLAAMDEVERECLESLSELNRA